MTRLSLQGITRRFGATLAVDDVSLDVSSGEFLTLLGDSGCGKTTLLRIVAGFTQADAGTVWCDRADITHMPPASRSMGFVFQSYALFPTKTVAGNIGFALKIAGRPRADIAARVNELAHLMEIERLVERYPHELSGGQQQRVALARALAPNPSILLLDEPLSALDARIRARLRDEIRAVVERLGITALYVTHDQEDALAISDRIAIMRGGRIEQLGKPDDIYHRPASRFVASFVGTANLIDGRIGDSGVEAAGRLWPVRLPGSARRGTPATALYRPEHLTVVDADAADFRGHVEMVSFLGSVVRLRVGIDGGQSLVVDHPSAALNGWRIGSPVALRANRDRAVVLLANP